jgi:hypothetical protein
MTVHKYILDLDAGQLRMLGRQTIVAMMSMGNVIENLAAELDIDLDAVVEDARDKVWTSAVFLMKILAASSGEFWTAVQNGSYLRRMAKIAQS